ncbi:MAG: ABC transporter ATP-binding protein [Candidatus Hydrogenedentota bacterium]
MLKLINVSAGYDHTPVIKNLNIEVNAGEIVTLIGVNGAGKTTTLLTISGIINNTQGNILFQDMNINTYSADKRVRVGISHVPEGRRIFPRVTVLENLKMGAYLVRDKTKVKEYLENVYSLFPILYERRKQLGGTLSGGEQQMLAIGRALMNEPRLLMLDEPSLGLAPIIIEKIFEIIKTINSRGVSILLVEQNAYAALHLANRGYVIETGNIILHDTSKNLLNSDLVKKSYLGEE